MPDSPTMRYENATTTQATSNLAANQIVGMAGTDLETGNQPIGHRRNDPASASLDSNAQSEAPMNFTDQAGITVESQPKSEVVEVDDIQIADEDKSPQNKMDTIVETGENEIDEELSEEDDDIQIFVESKYCTICHLEIPLRAKHCKEIDFCVATFDHYCPWVGNCIGERNKARFYWYLIVQHLQMDIAVYLGSKYIVENIEYNR